MKTLPARVFQSIAVLTCLLGTACTPALTQQQGGAATAAATYTSPLATGSRLDPAGAFIDLGSMPLAMTLSPEGDKVIVVLSGWREQGLQVVDLKSHQVTQTLKQD